jgi:hypothetical protein
LIISVILGIDAITWIDFRHDSFGDIIWGREDPTLVVAGIFGNPIFRTSVSWSAIDDVSRSGVSAVVRSCDLALVPTYVPVVEGPVKSPLVILLIITTLSKNHSDI